MSLVTRLSLAAIVPAMLAADMARAGVTYSNDQRFVRAQTSFGASDIKQPQLPLAPLQLTAIADSSASSGTCRGEASQVSSFSPTSISASGATTPSASVTEGSTLVFGASGSSVFKVSFTSDADAILDMQGSFLASGQGNFSTAFLLELSADAQPLLSTTDVGAFGFSQPIAAGVTYTLEVSATANAFVFFIINPPESNATASFELSATIRAGTCAGDLNADGFVDDADFTIFAAAYNLLDCADPAMPSGCPADLNGDAFVDDADFSLFAPAYDTLLCE